MFWRKNKEPEKVPPKYRIKPAITGSGTPTFELQKLDWEPWGVFFYKTIATNVDRAVLMDAVKHLNSHYQTFGE